MNKKQCYLAISFLTLMLIGVNGFASIHQGDKQRHVELGIAKSKVLGVEAYMPSMTIGSFQFQNQPVFDITLGFLSKDVLRLREGKRQELKNFFYLGPQFSKKYRLQSGLYSEVGVAVLTGSLGYFTSRENSSAYRDGLFFGVQPEVKFIFSLPQKFSFVFYFNYLLTSSNLDEGAADIGPSVGLGFRRDIRY